MKGLKRFVKDCHTGKVGLRNARQAPFPKPPDSQKINAALTYATFSPGEGGYRKADLQALFMDGNYPAGWEPRPVGPRQVVATLTGCSIL